MTKLRAVLGVVIVLVRGGPLMADPAHYFAGLYNDAGKALSLPTYDDRGRLDTFTDALGNPTAYLYSDDGLSETRIDAHGGTFTTTFDPRGNVTRTVNEIGAVSTTVYDERDNGSCGKIVAFEGDDGGMGG